MPHLEQTTLEIVRYGLVFARPTFHHFFHKYAEQGIHHATHKLGMSSSLVAKCKFIPDVVMVGLLIGVDHVTEVLPMHEA